jgi:hypothetical protein
MRNLWLGLALVPYLAAAGVDAWMHERGRKVPRVEQWIHAGLALSMTAFLVLVFRGHAAPALATLAAFVLLVAWDELAFHRGIPPSERRIHVASWAALAAFVVTWGILDGT